jgi:hypothetical protein
MAGGAHADAGQVRWVLADQSLIAEGLFLRVGRVRVDGVDAPGLYAGVEVPRRLGGHPALGGHARRPEVVHRESVDPRPVDVVPGGQGAVKLHLAFGPGEDHVDLVGAGGRGRADGLSGVGGGARRQVLDRVEDQDVDLAVSEPLQDHSQSLSDAGPAPFRAASPASMLPAEAPGGNPGRGRSPWAGKAPK